MTERETVILTTLLREAAVPGEWSSDKYALVASYLSPLPFEWAMKNARVWAGQPRVDARGHEQPKFLNDIPTVLAAVGVKASLVPTLIRAIETPGAVMMVDLRNIDELTLVGPTDPIPQGAYEYLRVNGLPVPDRPVKAIDYAPPSGAIPLPAPAPAGIVSLEEIRRRIKRPPAPVPREPTVPEAVELLAQLDRTPVPPEVKEAIKRLAWRLGGQITGLEEQRQIWEERVAELEDAFSGGRPGLEGLLEGMRHLAARARAGHRGALVAVLEAVARSFAPELGDVRVRVEPTDPLDDRSPPRRVLVDLRVPEPEEPPPRVTRQRAPERAVRMPKRFGDLPPRG